MLKKLLWPRYILYFQWIHCYKVTILYLYLVVWGVTDICLYLLGESWLGLQRLHTLTSQHSYQLKITMTDFDGKKYFAVYDQFKAR